MCVCVFLSIIVSDSLLARVRLLAQSYALALRNQLRDCSASHQNPKPSLPEPLKTLKASKTLKKPEGPKDSPKFATLEPQRPVMQRRAQSGTMESGLTALRQPGL